MFAFMLPEVQEEAPPPCQAKMNSGLLCLARLDSPKGGDLICPARPSFGGDTLIFSGLRGEVNRGYLWEAF